MAPLTGVLSPGQIKTYAQAAGFSGQDLNIATAIAIAESSGDPKAKNFVPCYGLWQVNMSGAMGAARRKRFNLKSNDDLYDPETNARVAYALYKDNGSKFDKVWTTYDKGSYKQWLSAAEKASSSADLGSKLGKVEQKQNQELANLTPWVAIANAIRQFTEGFRQFTLTSIVIGIALVLLVLGIILINEKSFGKAAKVGANVAKVAAL